ncbi:MAG: hypothetical protein AB8E82_14930 [Aureispira sp.]
MGTAVVNNENLTKKQIDLELQQIEQKEKLKDLDARLVEETEQWHTYMLKAKAGSSKKEKRIKRKPTKATNEEEVSEADRQLHQKIAAKVKERLEAKGKSTEGVETFEEFYGILKAEATVLQREFQPQLRNGIKIAVELINQVQQDKKDGDVDIKVKIAPNTRNDEYSIKYKLPLPPSGKAYILKRSNPRHFKAILSNGKAYDLELVGRNEDINIRIKNVKREVETENHVEVSVTDLNEKTLNKKIKRLINSYEKKKYQLDETDCFSFVIDLLNGVLDAGLRPVGDDNSERFESLKPEE